MHTSHVISDHTSNASGAPPAQSESPGIEEQIAALTSELEQANYKISSLESELLAASREITYVIEGFCGEAANQGGVTMA